ncbi:MAG: DUF389 domain-containing protein [Aestuariibaculum sp.]
MEENKFNFSEEEIKKENNVEESKKAVKEDAQGLIKSIKTFLSELLDFRDDTDREATIEAIKADIAFKGATAWILICSILVASVGLNANSTAVVIGAMLISPLMGPILGVGMSIAINDVDTLRKSLINLATMIVLSLLTAFLFFYLFPLSEDTSELLGRTKPDIRDVLIAFFGGLALIIARTKRGTIASVIFGVAIATALMPPLCTAGYGLAKGNMDYFLGAMYLFTINTIFIALATFLVLKLLRFTMIRYANSQKRRMISRVATILAIVVMIPAVWTFISVLNETRFESDASRFINQELNTLPHADFIKKNISIEYIDRENSKIELNTFGLDEIPESTITLLRNRLKNYAACANTQLIVNQNKSKNLDNLRYMEEIRYRDSLDLLLQSERIVILEGKLKRLEKLERNFIPFEALLEETKINYSELKSISFSSQIVSDFSNKIDTVSVFKVKWDTDLISETDIPSKQVQLEKWLRVKYDLLDSLLVKREKE